jgi:hypothetical protein
LRFFTITHVKNDEIQISAFFAVLEQTRNLLRRRSTREFQCDGWRDDHTDPETIRREFGMSKKTFKKIIGTLFREGKIEISDDGIRAV